MLIHVTSRKGIEELPLPGPSAVISITNPGSPPANIFDKSQVLDVLRLEFYDLEEEQEGCYPMTAVQADTVWEFALKWRDHAPNMVVHCEAGICRSSAVAAALEKALCGISTCKHPSFMRGNDKKFFSHPYLPNRLVNNLVINAAWKWYFNVSKNIKQVNSYD